MAKETKTLKVVSCIKTDREPDKFGNSSYNVKFEGDISGLYVGKKPQYFEANKTVQVDVEDKVAKSGVTWTKISLPQKEDTRGGGGGGYKKDPATQYRIAKTVALKVALKVKRFGLSYTEKSEGTNEPKIVKVSLPSMGELANKFLAYIVSKGESEGDTIAAQSALDLEAELLGNIDYECKSIEAFMEAVDKFFQYIIAPKPEPKKEETQS